VRNIDDPSFVREEYATEEGLEARQRAYRFAEGIDPNAVAIEAIVEGAPQTLLDAGCGTGRFSDLLSLICQISVIRASINRPGWSSWRAREASML
jgi:hypothetical protein